MAIVEYDEYREFRAGLTDDYRIEVDFEGSLPEVYLYRNGVQYGSRILFQDLNSLAAKLAEAAAFIQEVERKRQALRDEE